MYKIMVKKVTFVGFRGGDRPNRPPGPAPDSIFVFGFIVKNVLSHSYVLANIECIFTAKSTFAVYFPEALRSLVQGFSFCSPWLTSEPGKNVEGSRVLTWQEHTGIWWYPGQLLDCMLIFRILKSSIEECKKNNDLKYVKTSIDKKTSFVKWTPCNML